MKEYFFVSMFYVKPRATLIERSLMKLLQEEFQDRILSTDDIAALIGRLTMRQEDLLSQNKYPKRRCDIHLDEFERASYLYVGRSSMWLRKVAGSGKDAAASDTFNDGWWNCFESFAYALDGRMREDELESACREVLEGANIGSPEAYARAPQLTYMLARRIVEDYGMSLPELDAEL